MNRYLVSLVLIILFHFAYGQSETRNQFNGYVFIGEVNVTAPTNGGDHRIRTTFYDPRGEYSISQVQTGDHIWDTKCDRYEVVYVHATSPFLDVEVDELNTPSGAPNQGGGNAIIFRPAVNYDYPLITDLIGGTLKACIEVHRVIEIDEDMASGELTTNAYDSDSDAAAGGVVVGQYYELSSSNIYGGVPGSIKKRKI